jgi:hypothetical protein
MIFGSLPLVDRAPSVSFLRAFDTSNQDHKQDAGNTYGATPYAADLASVSAALNYTAAHEFSDLNQLSSRGGACAGRLERLAMKCRRM